MSLLRIRTINRMSLWEIPACETRPKTIDCSLDSVTCFEIDLRDTFGNFLATLNLMHNLLTSRSLSNVMGYVGKVDFASERLTRKRNIDFINRYDKKITFRDIILKICMHMHVIYSRSNGEL